MLVPGIEQEPLETEFCLYKPLLHVRITSNHYVDITQKCRSNSVPLLTWESFGGGGLLQNTAFKQTEKHWIVAILFFFPFSAFLFHFKCPMKLREKKKSVQPSLGKTMLLFLIFFTVNWILLWLELHSICSFQCFEGVWKVYSALL